MNKVVEYIIGAKDKTQEAIASAIARLKSWAKDTTEEIHKQIVKFREWAAAEKGALSGADADFERVRKAASSTYETLEQINARIDAPKKAAKAQEEMNRALQRYCELCEEAKRREQERLSAMRTPKSQWNQGPGAGSLYRPKDSGNNTDNAAKSITNLGNAAKSAIPAMMALDRMIGGMDGSMGKVASGLKGIIGMLLAFGPVGGVVAGVMLAMEAALNAYAEAQQKAINKIMEWCDAMRTRLAAFRENHFTNMVRELEGVAKAADRAADSFELAAKRRDDLARKREGLDAASAEAELQNMRRQMADDVANADDADKGRVAAAWKLQIAEREAELRERAAKASAASERESLETAKQRLDLANRTMEKLSNAASKAHEEYLRIKDITIADKGKVEAENDPEVVRYRQAYEAAEDRARAAAKDADAKQVEMESAQGMAEVSALNRANDVAKAYDAAKEAAYAYDDAERDYANAQIEAQNKAAEERERLERAAAEEEERMRLAIERRIAKERIDLMRSELAERSREESAAQARLAEATAKESQAWGWYRDRDSWAAQLQEERAEAEAQKQFDKDFDRLRRFRSDWRTSGSLSDEDELIRRVALAREEKAAAEEYAKVTAEATQRAADALDAIQQAIEEGGEA
ncbi:MAG: hypothetical protein IKF72_12625 [Kiritimatiellae bacterium]|nr:hypothetical protein [Kiritimatiellia bacterium]